MKRQIARHAILVAASAIVVAALMVDSSSAVAEPVEATASTPRPATQVQLAIYPSTIDLSMSRDYQSVVAVVRRDDGITVDVTDRVDWKIADEKFARLDGFTVHPVADGKSELVGKYSGSEVRIPIAVKNSNANPAISFSADVMPVLTRSGCNTGSCHGAARGKDGFRLSLFGFDPKGDYERITREVGVRRINLAVPSESLFLKKAIGAVPHTGGKLFEANTDYYKTIERWLAEGAKMDAADAMPPAVKSVVFDPPNAVIEGEGSTQRFVAVAHLADGSTRDVTRLAAFATNNAATAQISGDAIVTAGSRGEAFVTARYDTHTVGSQILTLPENLAYTPPKVEGNYIDKLIADKLQKLRIVPSDLCNDAEFLRRVTIDITGRLPTEESYYAFMNDKAPDKRAALIDQLLGRKEFSEIWAMKFAQLLMIKSSNQVSYKSAYLYATWLTDNFAREVPIDVMVRDLLTGTGGTFSKPQTNFYEMELDRLKTAENVSQVFMGIRTQCAQCHNHPFDRWTMEDYYGFAAFFSQVGRKGAEDYREQIYYDRRSGELNNPVTSKPQPATYLGGGPVDVKNKDRRQVVADWLTSGDNPYFARSIANRVWAHFMGVGNVDPVDDIRISNPPSNPELFDELGTRFVEYKFDFRQLVRDICNSHAYQRSTVANATNAQDSRNYAHAMVRRIPAETLLDCLSQVTESNDKFRGLPLGARAVQIADGATSNYFLTTFGRSPRLTACECEATTDPSLSQALHLLNGDSVHSKIAKSKQISRWLNEEKLSPEAIIDRIYIRSLSRPAAPEIKEQLLASIANEKDQVAALEDIYWAMLNSREFVFNH